MKKNIALVLSGGGARGLAHIGVIEELLKRDFNITSIAGTSMGALIGGVYATGKMEEYKKWVTGIDQIEVLKLLDLTLAKGGLIKGEKVLNKMKEFIPDTTIEDLSVPFSATAVDIMKHEEVVFTSGSLYDAIRASIAIPTVFTPVKKNGAILVDGGVMNNVPITNIKRTPKDILVAVYVNADIPLIKPPLNRKEEAEQDSTYQKWIKKFNEHLHLNHSKEKKESLGIMSVIDNALTTGMLTLAKYAIERGNPDILINVSRASCGTYDFYKAKEVIEIGRLAAAQTLDKLNAK